MQAFQTHACSLDRNYPCLYTQAHTDQMAVSAFILDVGVTIACTISDYLLLPVALFKTIRISLASNTHNTT